jgi:hypothetical protein
MFSGYGPHVVYSLAFLSASMHLVYQRRVVEDERRRIDSHLSVLNSLVRRLQNGEAISRDEAERLKRLGRPTEEGIIERKLTWKEALLGKKD